MKRRILIGLGIAAAVALVVILVRALFIPPAVQVAEAQQGEIVETLVATGEVVPDERPMLTADVGAPVESVEVQPGDEIEAGAVVARLDDTAARLEAEQARAGVREARARLEAVVDQGAPTALENLRQASVDLEATREEYDRARQLYDAGVGTAQAVDEARRAVDRAASRLEQARTNYREAREDGTDYDQAAAGLERAQANHRQARRRLDDYTIRAPADATVLERAVDPGDTVQPGSVVATLRAEGPWDIRINPDERELANIDTGQPALAVTDAYPDRRFEATVRRVEPAVDPERGTITVRLRPTDDVDFLQPAMTTTVEIQIDRRDEAVVVPRAAVRDLDTQAPWVVRFDDGRAVRHGVYTGLDDGQRVEITDGLGRRDVLVVDENVDPGDRIRRGDTLELSDPTDDRTEPDRELDPPEPPTARTGGSSR